MTEINAAKRFLYDCEVVMNLGLRQGRRREGHNRNKSNGEDIMLALHKSRTGLPTCVVSDLWNLPPLNVNIIDVGHTLSEFRGMRAEIPDLRNDVTTVNTRISDPVTWWQQKLTDRDLQPLHVILPP